MGAEVIEDHDVAWLEGWDKKLLDIGAKALAVDGTIEQAGRVDPILAKSGEERCRLPASLRDLVDEARSLRRQPRSRVMLVFVQVSSRKMRRLGSMSP